MIVGYIKWNIFRVKRCKHRIIPLTFLIKKMPLLTVSGILHWIIYILSNVLSPANDPDVSCS